MELAWNTQKNQMSDVKGKEMEQERKGKISNHDIDLERTKNNIELVETDKTLYQRVKERVDDLKEQGSRVQKNSVVMYSNILTVPEEQVKIWGEQKTDEYFKACYTFFCDEFGKENVVSAKIHKDETTPHMHLHFVPVNKENGKLQARVAMNKAKINYIHDALPKFLRERGFDVVRGSGKTKDANIEDIHEYKEVQQLKQAIQKQVNELDQRMERIQETKNELAVIKKIDSRKVEKGGFLNLTDKRVELSPTDYEKLIKMGRQNVKLRNENRELSSKAQEVAQREIELNSRLEKVHEREKVLNEHENTLNEREKVVGESEKRVKAMYACQSDLNGVLERVESENAVLRDENGVLRASVQKLEEKVRDLQKRLREAFKSLTSVVKAIGMFKHDDGAYKAKLTAKQANLVDAVSKFGEEQAKKEGFRDLAESMETKIGISSAIENHMPKQRDRSWDLER